MAMVSPRFKDKCLGLRASRTWIGVTNGDLSCVIHMHYYKNYFTIHSLKGRRNRGILEISNKIRASPGDRIKRREGRSLLTERLDWTLGKPDKIQPIKTNQQQVGVISLFRRDQRFSEPSFNRAMPASDAATKVQPLGS